MNNEASAGYLLPEDAVVEIEYGKTATVKMHNEKIDVPQTGDFRTSNSFWIVLGGVAAAGRLNNEGYYCHRTSCLYHCRIYLLAD